MSVMDVYNKIGEAIEGEDAVDIMAALTATTADVLAEMMLPGVSLDNALDIHNKQVRERFARMAARAS